MRYVKTNIAENFIAANGTKDKKTLNDLFIDQTSEVIAHHKIEFIKMLRDNGIAVGANPTYRELINKLVNGLETNKKLREGLADLIVKNQSVTSSMNGAKSNLSGYANLDGVMDDSDYGTNPNKGTGVGNTIAASKAGPVSGIIAGIGSAIGGIFGYAQSKKEAESAKETTKQSLYNVLAAKLGGQKAGLSTGAWIGIAVGTALIIVTVVFLVTKKK